METNYGESAKKKGAEDCNSIFKLHGLKTIKKIANHSLKDKRLDDYCIGKIEQAKEILNQYSKSNRNEKSIH